MIGDGVTVYNLLFYVVSLPSKTRRRTLGSPKRTRTQSTNLEAKPRRRYAVPHRHPDLSLHMSRSSLSRFWRGPVLSFPNHKHISLNLSRSGPREKWGISSTTWCSSTRLPTTSCTKKFPTTSSSHPLLCQRGWRSVALWPGTPSRSCSPKVNFSVHKYQNGAHRLRWKNLHLNEKLIQHVWRCSRLMNINAEQFALFYPVSGYRNGLR